MFQEPDAALLLQGATPALLAQMEPVTDTDVIERAREIAAANGGLLPHGTSAAPLIPRGAYVIGPDGTVYHRGDVTPDKTMLGPMGALNAIRDQHAAAKSRAVGRRAKHIRN
jgi:hypothetical protein